MATRPSLNIAVPKRKNKASEYNQNFTLMMEYIEANLAESKSYVDGYMPAISAGTKNKFLSNNGSTASWQGLGNQPFSNFIEGLILTKSSDDTLNISAGSCYDITKAVILSLAVATTKRNQSQAASSTYYVYIIGNGANNIDFLITTSSSNPTLPTGYVYYRQIGYYTTDENNKIENIYYYGVNSDSYHAINGFMPDYSSSVAISGVTTTNTTYNAPTDGYILANIAVANTITIFYVDDKPVFEFNCNASGFNVWSYPIPVTQGAHTLKVSGNVSLLLAVEFCPLKGANNA